MQGLLLAGRYRLGEPIGRGGMGRVWRAHDEVLNREVAVKELTAAQFVSDSDRAVMLARTQTEARAAARVNHPAVVTVHDVLEHDDRPWIVMELVHGRSLADALKESGPLDIGYAAQAGLWVLRALRAAHAAGVLHRDVKPGNVLLADDGRVLLTDFGIAQVEGDSTLTKTGEVVGSVDYLAPERVRGADPGPASDLWALGATLYTAVTARSPYRRTTPLLTMQAVVDEEPTPPDAGALTPVIMALLRKDPVDRPAPDELERMLLDAVEGRTPTSQDHYSPTAHHPQAPGGATGFGPPAAPAVPGYDSGSGQQQFGPTPTMGSYPHPYAQGADTPSAPVVVGPEHRRAQPRARRRGRTVAAVVLAAALLGGGMAFGFLEFGSKSDDTASSGDRSTGPAAPDGPASPDGSASAGTRKPTGDDVPDGWHRVNDQGGFSLLIPDGWQRRASGSQIDYVSGDGDSFVRIAVDTSPDWATPYEHQLDLEKQLQKLRDYQRVELATNTYRDRPGSRWNFTWTAMADDDSTPPGPRHAAEETYYSRTGTEYAIYMSSSQQQWSTTKGQFNTVLQSWRATDE